MDWTEAEPLFRSFATAAASCHALLPHFANDEQAYAIVKPLVGLFMGEVFAGIMHPLQGRFSRLRFAANDGELLPEIPFVDITAAFAHFFADADGAMATHRQAIQRGEQARLFMPGTLDDIARALDALSRFAGARTS